MARTPFMTPAATVVVSTGGYFDVFAPTERQPNDKPSYRGTIAELGATVREGDRLSVRPDSIALREAVTAWSVRRGASAVRGELGRGRDHVRTPEELDAARER
ncbi:MAG: hypothetical protein WEG56_04570 [Chloroflexota bacterium]